MSEYIDVTGKTIEDAVTAGLKKLGLDRDEVNVEVLEKQKSGFLGIGSQDAKVRLHYTMDETTKAKSFLEGLFERLKLDVKIDVEIKEDDAMAVDIKGGDMGVVIGRRGDTLDAIQYLTSLVVNSDNEKHYHVTVDAENYRAKRYESLERCARKVAGQAVKYKRSVTLEPMTPNERRIIHSTLQDYPGINTFSTGTEPNRRVVVAPEGARRLGGDNRTTNRKPQSGGSNGSGSNSSSGGNRRPNSRPGGYNVKPQHNNQVEIVDVE